jgi:HKD family nuclease
VALVAQNAAVARLTSSISQFWSDKRFGDLLIQAFSGPYRVAYFSVGFVKASGVRYLAEPLGEFVDYGGTVEAVVGVDGKVTTSTGVEALRRLATGVWLFRHPGRPLFHPKTYLFEGQDQGLAIIGSANLTESALWVNFEDAVEIAFDFGEAEDRAAFDELKKSFTHARASANAEPADDKLFLELVQAGLLPSETRAAREARAEDGPANRRMRTAGLLKRFPATPTPPPPKVPPLEVEERDRAANRLPRARRRGAQVTLPGLPAPSTMSASRLFVLRLGHRDVGSKRGYSPDVFIPLAAYRYDPAFWGTFGLTTGSGDPERSARFLFNRATGTVETARRRLYFYGARSEFRLSSPQVHEDGAVGDLLRIEVAPPGLGVDYFVDVLKPGHPHFLAHDDIATRRVPNSDKRWGYA